MLRNWLRSYRKQPPESCRNGNTHHPADPIAAVQRTQLFDGGTISFVETLYLSHSGAWFLEYTPGQRTTALDAEEAFTWLWQHYQIDLLRHHFPERLEGPSLS